MTAKLKFAFHAPPNSGTYQGGLVPFAQAVNAAAGGAVEIELYPDGVLGGLLTSQVDLVDRGIADAAFVIPGFTPERFPDNFVFGIPGLFRDIAEATLTFSRIAHAGYLRGYENYRLIGAFCTEPFSIHARTKLTTLADLKGMKLRAANSADEAMLKALGADARIVPGDKILDSIRDGTIDGTTLHAGPLFDLGISTVTRFDYFLRLGCAPLTILMNRQSFERLPAPGKAAIEKFGGEWFAQNMARHGSEHTAHLLAKMRADPSRTVTEPPQSEIDEAKRAWRPVIEGWLALDPRNRATLAAVEAEIAKLRAT